MALFRPCRKVRFYVTRCEIIVKWGKINSIDFCCENLKKYTPFSFSQERSLKTTVMMCLMEGID